MLLLRHARRRLSVSSVRQELSKCTTASQVETLALNTPLQEFGPSEVAATIKLLKQLDCENAKAVDRLLGHLEREKLPPSQVAELCSVVSVVPQFLLKQVGDNLHKFSGKDFVKLVGALSHNQEALLRRIAMEISKRRVLTDFDLNDMISLLAKYEDLGIQSLELCEKVSDEIFVLEDLKPLKAADFTRLVNCFAVWEYKDKDLFDKFTEELVVRRLELDDFTNQDFQVIMDGLLSLGYDCNELGNKFSSEMEARVTKAFFRKWNKVVYACVGTGCLFIVLPPLLGI
ncbi:hypothetical protein BASA81_007311 [Batrachochytrium salamandrivorans]|nr:hypothetical protein BASA81_007311 [Batrachochytrium salamandrivorans]